MGVNLRDADLKEGAWKHWQAQGMSREEFEQRYAFTIKHLEEVDAMAARGELTEDDEGDI